ncbi:MAG: amidohydrolase family protein [Bacteroidales bacterium]|nr:amidohydrolase family protein [Bacteroidales bacterium]
MKIIDCHCHIHKPEWVEANDGKDFVINKYNLSVDENTILANMEEAGISQTIIFPFASSILDLEKANQYTIDISKRYSDKLIPFTVIDNKPEYWYEQGCRGFKEHTYGQRIQKDSKGNDIYSQKFKQSYKFLEKNKLPLLLHAGNNRVERIIDDLLHDTPNLIIILAHLGADFPENNNYMPHEEQVYSTLEKLKDFGNVYFDISAVTEGVIIKEAINIVGDKRILFGADSPIESPLKTRLRLQSLGLSESTLENIFYNNINNILEL